MEEIGSEQLDRRLRWKRGDEIGRLAATFDAMLDRLQGAFARERQFISDASHEFKTPLTVINANAQLIRRWGDAIRSCAPRALDAIADESARLAEMVGGMLTLAKADSGDQIPKEPLALESARRRRRRARCANAPRKGPRTARRARSERALRPRRRGADPATRLEPRRQRDQVHRARRDRRRGARMRPATHASTVSDTGIGIAPETAERLFDRFFRGDPSHSRIDRGNRAGPRDRAQHRPRPRRHGLGARRGPRAAPCSRSSCRPSRCPRETHSSPKFNDRRPRPDAMIGRWPPSATPCGAQPPGSPYCIAFLHPAAANAASGSFLMGDQSVVQVLSGARSQITVKAWDRPNVQFDTDDEAAQVDRRPLAFGTAQNPLSVQIPVQNIAVRDPPDGPGHARNAAARRVPVRVGLSRRRARLGAHRHRLTTRTSP